MIVAVLRARAMTMALAAWSYGHDGTDRPGGVIIDTFHPVFDLLRLSTAKSVAASHQVV